MGIRTPDYEVTPVLDRVASEASRPILARLQALTFRALEEIKRFRLHIFGDVPVRFTKRRHFNLPFFCMSSNSDTFLNFCQPFYSFLDDRPRHHFSVYNEPVLHYRICGDTLSVSQRICIINFLREV